MTLRVGVLTISDRVARGEMDDRGGPAVEAALDRPDWQVVARAVVPDDLDRIAGTLIAWADEERLDVVITTGGTGLGPRDVTPEATSRVAERDVPGIAEAIRAASREVTPYAMLSRGAAAVRGRTLIINLPGSPNGAREGVEVVAPVLDHAAAIVAGGQH